jgi:dehydrogenase/reductase SDR family protein 7B
MNQEVIWITGATSGIGEALFHQYSKTDCKLIIPGRNIGKLESLKNGVFKSENVHVLPLDLTDTASFSHKVSEAINAFGKVDVLINNGGVSQRSLVIDTQLEVDRRIMEVNFFGTIGLSKALLPHFIDNKKGHFAVVSSLVGKFGSPYRSTYAASKHALHGFFDTLRAEHHKDNIAVTMVCPGFIRTNVSINALTGDGTPLQQMDDAQDKGMNPELCARKIVAAISNKKEEINIGGKEIYAVSLKRFFPLIFSKFIKKAKVR